MKHSKQGYLNWFLRLAMEGQTIPIFGEGLQRRDLNYVDDVVEALMLVGVSEDSNGEIFNLGSGEPITLLDSLKMIIDVVGRGDYVFKEFPEEKKQIEIGDYYANYDKVKHALGWTPKTTLRQGLEQSLAFYTEHGSQYWSKNEVERLIK
jgi:nucleoside-diphosphate-sugar epimerase